ncbi:MAG: AAA family ATPase [Acidobacteriota bacterium]
MKSPEGRERELDLLLERWRLALDDSGQVVFVRGDAGSGKTHLLRAFEAHTSSPPRVFLRCCCVRDLQYTAFGPLHELLQELEDRPAGRTGSSDTPEQTVRATLTARLKTLLAPRQYRPASALNLNPEGKAKKTIEALVTLFVEIAKRHPLILVVEDLEWLDPSTLEMLSQIVNRRPRVSLMVVLTFGPELTPPWGTRSHLTSLQLPPLTPESSELVVEQLAGRSPLPEPLKQRIVEWAEGSPFYLREMVRLAQSLELDTAGNEKTGASSIFQEWLAAHMLQLGAAADLARQAAALGDQMPHELLRAVNHSSGKPDLAIELDRLIEAGLLIRNQEPRDLLSFRHNLLRQAVLATLSLEGRQAAHRSAAKTLLASFPEAAERRPEIVAHHYQEGGMAMEAARAWCRAAEQAIRQAANLEAAARAQKGLELLATLPKDEARNAQEIALLIALGAALGTAQGYANPEAQASYDRAVELAWQTPKSSQLAVAMREMASYYISRGHIRTAREIAERALWHLDGSELTTEKATAHRNLGFAYLLAGDLANAKASLEESLQQPSARDTVAETTSQTISRDEIIAQAETLGHLALAQWFLGRPDRALEHSADALMLARRANDPFCRIFATYRASILHVLRREPVATRELAHELVELANRHGFLFFIAAGMFLEGQALTAQGRAAEGLQMMSGGLDGVWASGMEVGRPRNLALLAEACGRSELVEQGLSLIKEGLAAAEVTGESHYEAELYRIQGELLRFADAPVEEVLDSLTRARSLAREQGSRSLELRATISLSRQWQAQGQVPLALTTLTEIYHEFDEGTNTVDLQEARALLDNLS